MNIGQQALQVLRTVAPTVALAVGGPFGPLAAAAVSAALGTAPGDAKATETALLGATPDQLLALKKAENDFTVQMKQLEITEEKLTYDDTANARAREMAVKDSTPKIIAYVVLLLCFAMEGMILLHGQPSNVDGVVLGRIMATLENSLLLVLGYYFGSSAGSASKTDTLNHLMVK